MDRGEAFNTFRDCVAEVLDIEAEDVRMDARWREDLDADSLAVVEITLALNDVFSIKIPDVDPEEFTTVGQAFETVAALVGVEEGGSGLDRAVPGRGGARQGLNAPG
jgi:acyl carrier protein